MIVGIDEQVQMRSKLVVAIVVVALDRRVLDRAVHPLALSFGSRMVHLCQPMLDVMLVADAVEDVLAVVDVLSAWCELNAVVCEHGVDAVRHRLDEVAQELRCLHLAGALHEPHEGKLAGSTNGHEQPELAFGRAHLGDIDMHIADGVGCKALLLGFVAFDLG